jgi:hypothetical protein
MADDGYLWNCYLKPRDGDPPMFEFEGILRSDKHEMVVKTCTIRLDGYAIIPIEEYRALVPEAFADAA